MSVVIAILILIVTFTLPWFLARLVSRDLGGQRIGCAFAMIYVGALVLEVIVGLTVLSISEWGIFGLKGPL